MRYLKRLWSILSAQRKWSPQVQVPVDSVSRIILISTDTFGPQERWLVVQFRDGTEASIESVKNQEEFLGKLGKVAPDPAREISEALSARDDLMDYERIWTLREEFARKPGIA
jgi:hypothetical protein